MYVNTKKKNQITLFKLYRKLGHISYSYIKKMLKETKAINYKITN